MLDQYEAHKAGTCTGTVDTCNSCRHDARVHARLSQLRIKRKALLKELDANTRSQNTVRSHLIRTER